MNWRKSILVISLLLFGVNFTIGQTARDTTWKRSDFIANTNDYFSLKLDAHNETNRLQFSADNYYDIRPNTDVRNRLSFNYKWLTVGVSFRIKSFFGNDDKTKGDTETSSINFALNFDRWAVNFNHTNQTGYYLANSSDVDPMITSDDFILFPDFNTRSTRLFATYLTNTKFSLKSLTSLTERQLKSNGTFLPYMRMNYFQTKHGENDVLDFNGTSNFQANFGMIYTHQFLIFNNFYVAGAASIGGGSLWYNTKENGTSLPSSGATWMYSYHYGLRSGYNGDRFFVGANYNRVVNGYDNQTQVNISTERNSFEVFIGYRFRVPKFLRKPLDFVDGTKEKVLN